MITKVIVVSRNSRVASYQSDSRGVGDSQQFFCPNSEAECYIELPTAEMSAADADNSTDPLMGADESSQDSIRTDCVNQGGQSMPRSFVRLPNVKFEYDGGESSTTRCNVVFPDKTDETGLHVYLPTGAIAKQCLTMIKRSFPGAKFVQNAFEPQESLDMPEETCQGEPSTSPDFVGFNDPDEYEVGFQNKCLATRRSTLGLKRLENKTLGKTPDTNGPKKVDIKKILRLKGVRRKKRKRIFTMRKPKLHAPIKRIAPATANIPDSSPMKKRGRPFKSSLPLELSSVVNEETKPIASGSETNTDSPPKKKRGRPFKSSLSLELTSETNEKTNPIAPGTTITDSPPKKKRGRPFKSSLPLELRTVVNKETKPIAPGSETNTDSPPKKKRGRPFKSSLPLELTSETNEDTKPILPVTESNTDSPPKKKRGRPFKSSLPLELMSVVNEESKPILPVTESNTDAPPKKKRGRPFKSSLPLELTSTVNQKRRLHVSSTSTFNQSLDLSFQNPESLQDNMNQMKKTEQTSENEEEIFSSPLYENTPHNLSNMTGKKKRGRPAGPLKKKLLVSSTYTEVVTEKKRRGRPPGPLKKNMIIIKKAENIVAPLDKGVSEESIKKATEKFDEISGKRPLRKHSAEDFMPGTMIRVRKKQINFVKKRGRIPVKLGTFDVTPTDDNITGSNKPIKSEDNVVPPELPCQASFSVEKQSNGFGLIISNVMTDNSTYIDNQPEGEDNVVPPKIPCQAQDSLEKPTSDPGLITVNSRTENSISSTEQLEGEDKVVPPKLLCQAQDSLENPTSDPGLITSNAIGENSTKSIEHPEGEDNVVSSKLPCQAPDSVEDRTSVVDLVIANTVTEDNTNSTEQLEGEDNVVPPKFPCQAPDSVEDQTSDTGLIIANNVTENSTNSTEQLEGDSNVEAKLPYQAPDSVEDPSDPGLTFVNSMTGNNSEKSECFKPKSSTAETLDKTASPVKPASSGVESETTSTELYVRETQENSVPIVVSVASIAYEDLQ